MKEQKEENVIMNENNCRKKKYLFKFVSSLIGIGVIVIIAFFIVSKLKLGSIFSSFSKNSKDFVKDNIIGSEGKVTTITESTIKDVFEINELQTVDYIYNAVAHVYDSDGKTLKYYVAYNGKITAGINFNDIKIDISDNPKEIIITVPDVTIQDTVVDAGTLEYIYTKNKYKNENNFQEAYSECQSELDEKASTEPKLLNMAKENAKQVIEALVEPWVEQIDSEYTVTIR
ncbi:MAG: DUF4230 domain-containing protein [Eubacteriales bacterium]|nr:DUF4230 domain-containing protein [Eubacteriales bacterium]